MLFKKYYLKKITLACLGGLMLTIGSCEEENIADVGDLPDQTPPQADFSTVIQGNGLTYQLNNASTSATDFEWILPEGVSFQEGFESTSKSVVIDFATDGVYNISLRASDKLLVSNTVTKTLSVIEKPRIPDAKIIFGGFDKGINRAVWTKESIGIKYTGTGNFFKGTPEAEANGDAAKLNAGAGQAVYQTIEVTPETKYIIRYVYSMKTTPVGGQASVFIVAGDIDTRDQITPEITLGKKIGEEANGSSNHTPEFIEFNSGANTQVSIVGFNGDTEVIYDEFSIETIQPF